MHYYHPNLLLSLIHHLIWPLSSFPVPQSPLSTCNFLLFLNLYFPVPSLLFSILSSLSSLSSFLFLSYQSYSLHPSCSLPLSPSLSLTLVPVISSHPSSCSLIPLYSRNLPSPPSLCTPPPGEPGRATILAFPCRTSWPWIDPSRSSSRNVSTTSSARVSQAFFISFSLSLSLSWIPLSSVVSVFCLLFLVFYSSCKVQLVCPYMQKVCGCLLWKYLPCLSKWIIEREEEGRRWEDRNESKF